MSSPRIHKTDAEDLKSYAEALAAAFSYSKQEEWGARLEQRSNRFQLSVSPSKRSHACLAKVDSPLIEINVPSKRSRNVVLAANPSKRSLNLLDSLLGDWHVSCRGGKRQWVSVSTSSRCGRLSCAVWKRDCRGDRWKHSTFKISISPLDAEVCWGSSNQVKLDKQTLTRTRATWCNQKGKSWTWWRSCD